MRFGSWASGFGGLGICVLGLGSQDQGLGSLRIFASPRYVRFPGFSMWSFEKNCRVSGMIGSHRLVVACIWALVAIHGVHVGPRFAL